ncbi:MAG: serine hydrolase domain-containing protein, partial [Gammaproteobacteria bacterium]
MAIRTSKLFLISCFLAASIGLASAAEFARPDPESLGFSSERLQRLDAMLESYVAENLLAGQVVMVLRHGQIAFSAANGWRDKENGVVMTEDSIFRIASQTKAIVSTGIMILQEQGKLDISDPLSRYFPEWQQMQVAVTDGNGGYR